MGCGKQVASRRALAWNRWVGWAPGLVNHTLLHPACLPSLSVSRRQLYSSRRKCIPAYTSRPREAERYVGGGTLSVSQTASRSSNRPPQPSESRAEEASHQHQHQHCCICYHIAINNVLIFFFTMMRRAMVVIISVNIDTVLIFIFNRYSPAILLFTTT